MGEQKKEQQREHELQCNGLQCTNCNKCRYINVLLIPKNKFNYNTKKWIIKYTVQSIYEAINCIDFISKNKEFLIQ